MTDDSGMDWEPGFGPAPAQHAAPARMYLEEQVGSATPPGDGTPGAITPAHTADTTATHYLAIDTNVFLSRFDEVRALHDRLALMSVSAWILLPGRVVAELDGLKSSIKPNPTPARPDESLGETARRATNWLLSIARGQLRGGRGRVRGQKRTEQAAAASKFALGPERLGDDDILVCCLDFASRGTPVSLWTDDRNLALQAETNDIATFPAAVPLPSIARSLGVEWNGDECMDLDTEPITDAQIEEYPIFDRSDLAMPPNPREAIKPGEWAQAVAAARGTPASSATPSPPRSAFASAMSAVARQPPPGAQSQQGQQRPPAAYHQPRASLGSASASASANANANAELAAALAVARSRGASGSGSPAAPPPSRAFSGQKQFGAAPGAPATPPPPPPAPAAASQPTRLPPHLASRLLPLLGNVCISISMATPTQTPVTTAVLATPQALTGHLVEQLNALDSALPPGHDLLRPLARSIASARTLNAFFGPPPARGERRVRAGETADAFIVLAQQLAAIGVPGIDVAQWRAVADDVRVL
ncbi:hypothetical protein Q8F55_001282 [Vanrija albida]|uniref:PIN domain-containing protein n=1 Tax=Vanrija albida TaxID=181172 RepID=A0ABR3QGH9_9TREE